MAHHGRGQARVDLRCTLVDTTTGLRQDLDVAAPRGTTLGELLTVAGQLGATAHVNGQAARQSDLLGLPPLVDGCLVVLEAPEPGASGRPPSLTLDVVGGPDSGRSLPLGPGDHVIGRCAPAQLRLDDNDVSRQHAVVTVTSDAVTAQDLGSTNGSWLTRPGPAGGPAPLRAPTRLPVGGRLRAGRSTLELRAPHAVPAQVRATGTGTVEVNRPPRHRPRVEHVSLSHPPAPAVGRRTGLPWVGMAVPLVLSLGAAWMMHQASYLLFGLMSPLVLAATAVVERFSGRRRARRDHDEWCQQLAEVRGRAQLALAEERADLRRQVGDPCSLSRVASLPGARLWERTSRDDDVLAVSVGTADVTSRRVCWVGPSWPLEATDPDDASINDSVLREAPVVVSLRDLGHLGVCGDRETALRLLRWLIAQVAVWHAPSVVRVAIVSDDVGEWGWTRWLPHHVTAGTTADDVVSWLDDLVRRRTQLVRDQPWTSERVVVVVDGDRFTCAGVRDALGCRDDIGVHLVCLAADRRSLPSDCGAVASVAMTGEGRLSQGGRETTVTVDGARRSWADDIARSLAPWRDATPTRGHLPDEVHLSDLLPVDAADACAIASLWRTSPRSARVVVGVCADGPLEIDLVTDGPHILVGGTTGSGKSELLRTLVTSLAVVNRPDELVFVLVDYKGGAAFHGCADLVHTIGLVTDLDDQLAARALVSLQSELTRRERQLKEAGCRDLPEYHARRDADPTLPALPRLVLVVDEFRVLASELPDFLDGIVRVAAVGRSLGIHVVLATQRPAGVVSADIKANVNLRICLRVRDRGDSDDVIDTPDAAGISPETPGRALLRRADDGVAGFQVATVEDGRGAPEALVVRRRDEEVALAGAALPPHTRPRGSHLTRVAASCREAAASLGIADPEPVWQPPLPNELPLRELEALEHDATHCGAPLGLMDLPEAQDQAVLRWHPVDDGHLAIAGGARTGRTTALLTLAVGLARRWSPDALHLHVVTTGGKELTGLAGLPHVGSVVSADEPHRVARLVDTLNREAERRRAAGTAVGSPPPTSVLLVDGWEAVTEQLGDVDHGRPVDGLLSLLRDGQSVGIRAVVTGGRGVLLSRVGSVIGSRLLLRPNDPTDLLLAGVPSHAVPAHQPAGRALRPGDGAQLQIATPPPLDHVIRQVADRWPAINRAARAHAPVRISRLPDRVETTSLDTGGRPDSWALVGQSELGLDAAGLDLADHRFVLVAGPPASGRSTTLTTMARSLHARGLPLLSICPAPSPLAAGPWAAWRPEQVAGQQHLQHAPVVLVDDVERVLGTPLEPVLATLVAERGRTVVAAGDIGPLLGAFRGLATLGRVHRSGVLLRPQRPSDGEVLGVQALLDDAAPVGRGVLVERGLQTVVHVAITSPDQPENDRRSVGAGTYG